MQRTTKDQQRKNDDEQRIVVAQRILVDLKHCTAELFKLDYIIIYQLLTLVFTANKPLGTTQAIDK
jgi:hypothetical protein